MSSISLREGVIPAWAVDTQTLGWLDRPNKGLVSPVGLRVGFPPKELHQDREQVLSAGEGEPSRIVFIQEKVQSACLCAWRPMELRGRVRLCPCPCRAGLSSPVGWVGGEGPRSECAARGGEG